MVFLKLRSRLVMVLVGLKKKGLVVGAGYSHIDTLYVGYSLSSRSRHWYRAHEHLRFIQTLDNT